MGKSLPGDLRKNHSVQTGSPLGGNSIALCAPDLVNFQLGTKVIPICIEGEVASTLVGAPHPKVIDLNLQDQRHLDAAHGWLGLGSHLDANEELENITPVFRIHPQVLRVRYEVCAVAKNWQGAADIAGEISRLQPHSPFGLIHCAFALHELKRTSEALSILLPIATRFPNESVIPYNLACYTCQLGDLISARAWLSKAYAIGEAAELKQLALDDPDLEPLWNAPHQPGWD